MKKLASRLKLTRTNLFGALFNRNKPGIDNNIISELEDRFLLADIGTKTTDQIIQLLTSSQKERPKNITIETQIKQLLLSILEPVEKNFRIPCDANKPYLILVVVLMVVVKRRLLVSLRNTSSLRVKVYSQQLQIHSVLQQLNNYVSGEMPMV